MRPQAATRPSPIPTVRAAGDARPGLAARRAAAALLAGVLDRGRSLADQAGRGRPAGALAPAERARAQALAAGDAAAPRADRRAARPASSRAGRRRPALNALRLAVAEMHLDGGAGARGGRRRGAAGAGRAKAARSSPGSSTPWRGGWPTAGRRSGTRRPRRRCRPGWPGRSPRPGAPRRPRRSPRRTGAAAPLDLTLRRPARGRRTGRRRSAPSCCRPAACGCAGRPQVSALPGYAEGAWWVQDAAAALPARLFGAARRAARRSTSAPRRAARRCSSPPPARR